MTYIILSGPSSVGKTTYAQKHYKDYFIIDSDDVWFELAKEYNWDKKKINKNLFRNIYEKAKKFKDVIIVHTNPTPLLKYFNRKQVTILLLATNFNNLKRNLNKRKDRYTENVLSNEHNGYLFHFEKTDSKDNSLYLRKHDLDNMPIKTKNDKIAIDNVKKVLFTENRKTTRIKPKSNVDYDSFIII